MTTDGEASLLADLRGRDGSARREAQQELFERYREPVARLLRRLLGDDLDDCLQEVFVDVFRGLPGFAGRSSLSTWVYRVALRRAWKCAGERRRADRGREQADGDLERAGGAEEAGEVGAELAGEELARRFARALQRLSLDLRTVLALSAVDGLSPGEVAEVLGVPVGTVHSRLARARERMRELLGLAGAP